MMTIIFLSVIMKRFDRDVTGFWINIFVHHCWPGLRYKSYMKFIWKSLAMDKEWPSKPLNREQQFWYFAKKMIIEKFYYFWAVRFALNQLLRFTLFTMQFSFLQRLKTNQLAHIDQQIQ